MTKEQIQDFTRRVTQANRSGLVLIKFEMLFVYFEDIRVAFEQKDDEMFKAAVRHADAVLKSFQDTLDFTYGVSAPLYSLYDFHRRQLAKVMMRHSLDGLGQSEDMLKKIYQGFSEASKQDTSKPLMANAQQVYAGYTYGKHDLNEDYQIGQSRGFLV